MKFRLLVGDHIQDDKLPDGKKVSHRYHAGDIIESDIDLVQRFNTRTSRKFERLHDNYLPPPPTDSLPPDDGLDQLTTSELKSIAHKDGIDLKGASRKEDILRILRQLRYQEK